MAATTSLLLRNASEGQLRKGIPYCNLLNQSLAWSICFYFAILMKKDKKIPVLHVYKQSVILLFTHDALLNSFFHFVQVIFYFSLNKLFSGRLSALYLLSQTQLKPKILVQDQLLCKLVESWLILYHFAKQQIYGLRTPNTAFLLPFGLWTIMDGHWLYLEAQ